MNGNYETEQETRLPTTSNPSEPRYPDIVVQLTGTDGNAFAILGRVRRALRDHGVDPAEFSAEATSGDYNHLLATCMSWVEVQ